PARSPAERSHPMPRRAVLLLLAPLLLPGRLPAADRTVEQLTEAVRKSVVVVEYTGRDGKKHGVGTGFVVSADGLIATNFHVIGEARPVTVVTPDGKRHDVTPVHA